jgi:proton-translocating NADH-quinone oxidoreductase chain N
MYLAVELQSLCFYVLAASKRNSEFSTEAGLKYFLLGAFSSGLLLFGCSLIYGFTGVTNFSELAKIFTGGTGEILYTTSSLPACELGMVFLLVGFLFKITAVPFHMWSPDVYEGAPTWITAFFMITPKAALFAVFVRIFFESFYDFLSPWQKLIMISSLGSMILGTLAALSQTRIKRLLAFSSIGHVGYLLAGFACGTVEGIQALLIYLVVYIFMNVNLFAFLLCGIRREHTQQLARAKYITDFTFLAKSNPFLALTFTVTMFSMAGIPPLAGFYSKAFLFFAALSSNLYILAVVGVLCSVLSCFYYIRLIKIMYFEGPKNWCSYFRIPKQNALVLAISMFFILFLMLYPSPLHIVTHKITLILCL